MSALCGIVHLDDRPVPESTLEGMMHALAHRGIDGIGTWRKDGAAMGHLMLHGTPESIEERLPFHDAALDMAITADARVDNREELFDKLEIPPGQWGGMPDSLLLLKAYERWGTACAEHLLGDFAFAIWSGASRELILVTDPVGVRTLYYYHTPHTFIFASEIKAILAVPGVPKAIHRKKIASLAIPALRHLEPDTTFFEGIRVLPGATVMRVSRKGLAKEVYWRPDPHKRIHFADETQYGEAFREIFEQAVSARLRSAFPVTSLYSGGLDSAAVSATAARLLDGKGQRLNALSAVLPPGYRGSGTDERRYVDLLKNGHGVDIAYICDPWRGPFDDLDRLVAAGDRPAYMSRHFLYTAFAEKARRIGSRVLLAGDGGELGASFHGDGYYAELLRQGKWGRLGREILLRASREERPAGGLVRSLVIAPLMPHGIINRISPPRDVDLNQQLMPLRVEFLERVLGKDWQRIQSLSFSFRHIRPNHRANQSRALSILQRGRLNGGFVGCHRVYMAFPFLDRRVLEFCLAAPGDMKVRDGYTRYLIRAAMRGILPDALRLRTDKNPFSPDFHDRYNRQRPLALEWIARARSNREVNEIIDLDKLARMMNFTMQSNRCSSAVDFACMHAVPRCIYLICFLEQYAK